MREQRKLEAPLTQAEDFTVDVGRQRAIRPDLHSARVERLDRAQLGVVSLEYQRQEADHIQLTDRRDDAKTEQPIVYLGVGCQQERPGRPPSIRDRHQQRLLLELRSINVDLQLVRAMPEHQHLEQRDEIEQHAAQPPDLLALDIDLCIQPDTYAVGEETIVDPSQIDQPGIARDQPVERLGHVAWQTHRVGEIVARSGRDDAQFDDVRRTGIVTATHAQPVDDLVDGPVAAQSDDGPVPLRDGEMCQLDSVPRILGQ